MDPLPLRLRIQALLEAKFAPLIEGGDDLAVKHTCERFALEHIDGETSEQAVRRIEAAELDDVCKSLRECGLEASDPELFRAPADAGPKGSDVPLHREPAGGEGEAVLGRRGWGVPCGALAAFSSAETLLKVLVVLELRRLASIVQENEATGDTPPELSEDWWADRARKMRALAEWRDEFALHGELAANDRMAAGPPAPFAPGEQVQMVLATDLFSVAAPSAGSVGQVLSVDRSLVTVAWPGFGEAVVLADWLQPACFCDCGALWITGNGLEKLAVDRGYKIIAQQVGLSRRLKKYKFELESGEFWEAINKWFVRSCRGTIQVYLNIQPEKWKPDATETWTQKYLEKFVFKYEIPTVFEQVPHTERFVFTPVWGYTFIQHADVLSGDSAVDELVSTYAVGEPAAAPVIRDFDGTSLQAEIRTVRNVSLAVLQEIAATICRVASTEASAGSEGGRASFAHAEEQGKTDDRFTYVSWGEMTSSAFDHAQGPNKLEQLQ